MRKWIGPTRRWQLVSGATLLFWVVGPQVAMHAVAQLPAAGRVEFQPSPAEADVPARFRLEAHPFAYRTQSLPPRWFDSVREWEVTFPSPVTTEDPQNNTVHCEYFHPRGDGTHAGVIVLHILGGDFELSRTISRSLAVNGVGALFLKMPYYGPRRVPGRNQRMVSADLQGTVAGMTQAVLDIRRATAWLAARDEIDPTRLGIMGVSLGGIVAGLAAAGEPRLGSVCLVLAGGDLEQIIRESVETRQIRDEWATRQFDLEKVRAELAKVDPLTYADQLKRRRILMFNARHDRSIPVACTNRLWEALGRPPIHWWNATHYSAAWYLPSACLHMASFFRDSDSPTQLQGDASVPPASR